MLPLALPLMGYAAAQRRLLGRFTRPASGEET